MTSLFPKKVLVFLLSFFMIFGFISCSSDSSDTEDNRAFSVGSSKYATLQEAVDSISNTLKSAAPSYTIKLLRDVSDAGATIPNIGGNLTIDFGDYTYTLENSEKGITIEEGATGITIANGNIVPGNGNTFTSIITSSGELSIDGLDIDAENSAFDAIKADKGAIEIKGSTEIKVSKDKNALNLSDTANAKVVSEDVSLSGGLSMAGSSTMDLIKGDFKLGKTSLGDNVVITTSESSTIEALDEADTTVTESITNKTKYLVTFDVKGLGEVPEQRLSGVTATKPEDPAITGYIFDGWYADADCTTEWDFNNNAITANTTIYAKLDPMEFTITFDVQGIGTAPEALQIFYGETIEEPEDIEVDGYTFGGWYEDADCTIEWNFETAITENTTLYAKWEKVSGTNAKLSEEEVQFIMENLYLYWEMIDYSDDLKEPEWSFTPALVPGATSKLDVFSDKLISYTITLDSYFTDNLYKASGYISYEAVLNSHETIIQDLDSIVIDGEEHSVYIKIETTLDIDTQKEIRSLYVKMDEKEYVSSFIVEHDEHEEPIDPPASKMKEMHNAVLDIRNLMEEAVENKGILNIANVTVSDYTSENSYAFGKLVFDNYVGNNNLKLSGESTFVAYLFDNGNIDDFKLINDLTVTNLTSNNQNEYGFSVRLYYGNYQRINLNVRRIGNQEFHYAYIYDFNNPVFDEPTDSSVDSAWENSEPFGDEGNSPYFTMTYVFYEDGTFTNTTCLKELDGEVIPESTYTIEGTYSATSDTTGIYTYTYWDEFEEKTITVNGSYVIDGNVMTATEQGMDIELTKVE